MQFQRKQIKFPIGLGLFLGTFMVVTPFWSLVSFSLVLLLVLIVYSPYFGIILLIFFVPFQPFIRELVGGSLFRFWKEVLLMLLFFTVLIKVLWNKQHFNFFQKFSKTSPTLWSAIIFISYMVLRSVLGPLELITLSALAEYCLYSLFFIVCLLVLNNSKHVFGIFVVVSIVATLMALGGIWESILGREYIIRSHNIIDRSVFPRSASFMESPLELGCYLALSFPLILSSIHEARTKFKRIFLIILAMIVIVGLGTTGSRTPWLQSLLSILVYIAIHPDFSFPKRLKFTFVTGFVLISILVSISILFPFIGERIKSIVDWEKDPGNVQRIRSWRTALNHISDAPIIGKGLGAESFLRGSPDLNVDLIERQNKVQESLILKIWLQSGFIGLFCFVYLYFSAVRCAYTSRRLPDTRLRYLGVAITSCFFGLIVEILVTQTLHSWPINMIFWCFIAISTLLNSDKLCSNKNLDKRRFNNLRHSPL